MTTTTVADALPSKLEAIVRVGRVAIGTQGLMYVILGLLAVQVSRGDHGAKPSQRGAIEAVSRQPFGKALLVVVALGLACHAAWRLLLAVRGEPGDAEDGSSLVKRAENVGRALLYGSLTVAAVSIVLNKGASGGSGSGGGSGGGSKEKQSTAIVLSWPAGKWIVIAVGLGVIAAGLWNAKRAVTRTFLDELDCSSIAEAKERTVEVLGVAGYLARACTYSLVGWFLINAGWQHDSSETEGLDGALRELAGTSYGPSVLRVVAAGLVLFGVYRVLDAFLRKPAEIAYL